NEEQKRQYLPKLASGEWIGAYALSEPNSGSDALSATTRADLKGDHYILNGTKMWISNAKWADLFLVMAKIDGDKFSAFLVERDFPGISVSREEHKMGLKGSSTARLVLESAEVPKENLLHEVGKGHQVAFNALNLGRFKLSSMSMGPARDAIGLAAAYARERKQFGQPLASFELIQKKLAMSAALFYVAESMTYRTGALIDEAFEAMNGDAAAAEEFSIECSACKVFSTEAEASIIDECLQIYGGYGFTEEFPIARHYRDARVSRIYEGTNEINRLFMAPRLLRRVKEGRSSLDVSVDSFLSELAASALKKSFEGQIATAAISDLLMLTYAEQSARLRSQQVSGLAREAYALALPYLNMKGAEAFQNLTGETVSLPAAEEGCVGSLAAEVHPLKGPLTFS
ncbi:MAG TPA: acyl-CoA dehydrogenase family protein, partial [Fimbriimonas sp.]|nr:acyl-CoA dehydrogenase family protein [Fimbriimonas sp.]